MSRVENLEQQALLFGRYYLRQEPSREAIKLYEQAIAARPTNVTQQDARLMEFALAHAWLLGCLDGGLALARPHAELRRRLFIMFAILEVQPEYADYFLPRERGSLYLIRMGLVGIRAVTRAAIGLAVIRITA